MVLAKHLRNDTLKAIAIKNRYDSGEPVDLDSQMVFFLKRNLEREEKDAKKMGCEVVQYFDAARDKQLKHVFGPRTEAEHAPPKKPEKHDKIKPEDAKQPAPDSGDQSKQELLKMVKELNETEVRELFNLIEDKDLEENLTNIINQYFPQFKHLIRQKPAPPQTALHGHAHPLPIAGQPLGHPPHLMAAGPQGYYAGPLVPPPPGPGKAGPGAPLPQYLGQMDPKLAMAGGMVPNPQMMYANRPPGFAPNPFQLKPPMMGPRPGMGGPGMPSGGPPNPMPMPPGASGNMQPQGQGYPLQMGMQLGGGPPMQHHHMMYAPPGMLPPGYPMMNPQMAMMYPLGPQAMKPGYPQHPGHNPGQKDPNEHQPHN